MESQAFRAEVTTWKTVPVQFKKPFLCLFSLFEITHSLIQTSGVTSCEGSFKLTSPMFLFWFRQKRVFRLDVDLFVFLHLFSPPPSPTPRPHPFLYLSTHALARACALNSTSKTVYHTWIRLIRLFITPTPPAAVVQWILSVFTASTAPSSAFSAKEKSPLLSFFFIFFSFSSFLPFFYNPYLNRFRLRTCFCFVFVFK